MFLDGNSPVVVLFAETIGTFHRQGSGGGGPKFGWPSGYRPLSSPFPTLLVFATTAAQQRLSRPQNECGNGTKIVQKLLRSVAPSCLASFSLDKEARHGGEDSSGRVAFWMNGAKHKVDLWSNEPGYHTRLRSVWNQTKIPEGTFDESTFDATKWQDHTWRDRTTPVAAYGVIRQLVAAKILVKKKTEQRERRGGAGAGDDPWSLR